MAWKPLAGWFRKPAPKAYYDAARIKRRLAGWIPSTASARRLLETDGERMRARVRDLVRNNSHAAAACECFVANLIGAGIKPSSKIADPSLRAAVQEAWLDWTDECDFDGLFDFYGLQAQIGRAVFEAGECFVRFHERLEGDSKTVPLQLQLLESDMLDMGFRQSLADDHEIFNGVEFDPDGRRVAYHFWVAHPGEMTVSDFSRAHGRERIRVPASEVLHIANLKRPGQVRGVPIPAPSVVKLWLLDQYDDAELDRKKTAAMYAGFITSPAPEALVEDQDTEPDDGILTLEPGTMQVLKPGEEIAFSAPTEVGGSYEAFQYRNLLAAFSGMGIPYILGTGDVSRANYSSMRGEIVEFRRRLEQMQHNTIVFQLCRPVWQRWLDDGVLSGVLDIPNYAAERAVVSRAKWIPPKFDYVDPAKDVAAEADAVAAGFKSRSDVIEASGEDPEEVDRRIAADKARETALGLAFPKAASHASPDPAASDEGVESGAQQQAD